MSRRPDLRAAAAQSTAQRVDKPEPIEAVPATERVKRVASETAVRTTVDLRPVDHKSFTRWCNEAADKLDVTEVKKAVVIRALLAELQEDQELADKIRRRISS